MRLTYLNRFQRPNFGTLPNTGDWQDRHLDALRSSDGSEQGIYRLLHGWATYADRHRARFELGIGEDYVLGPPWAAIGAALRNLLNGDLGRLDGGTLDAFICNTLAAEGFDPDNF